MLGAPPACPFRSGFVRDLVLGAREHRGVVALLGQPEHRPRHASRDGLALGQRPQHRVDRVVAVVAQADQVLRGRLAPGGLRLNVVPDEPGWLMAGEQPDPDRGAVGGVPDSRVGALARLSDRRRAGGRLRGCAAHPGPPPSSGTPWPPFRPGGMPVAGMMPPVGWSAIRWLQHTGPATENAGTTDQATARCKNSLGMLSANRLTPWPLRSCASASPLISARACHLPTAEHTMQKPSGQSAGATGPWRMTIPPMAAGYSPGATRRQRSGGGPGGSRSATVDTPSMLVIFMTRTAPPHWAQSRCGARWTGVA